MQLQPDTYYRTRRGEKVYIFGEHPFKPGWFVGVHDNGSLKTWRASGAYLHEGDGESYLDLIAVWRDRPADEPGWEIVDDDDAVVEKGWEITTEGGWNPCENTVGCRVCDMRTFASTYYWYRRPAPPPPTIVRWAAVGDSDRCFLRKSPAVAVGDAVTMYPQGTVYKFTGEPE